MRKFFYFIYALVCYLVFFTTFLYLIGFVLNIPAYSLPEWLTSLFPKTLGVGSSITPFWSALFVNLLLISLFGIQHSVMARGGFKAVWTKIVPAPIERSTYVLFSSAALIVMFLFWQPMNGVVWDFSGSAGAIVIIALSLAGWAIVILSTYLINHFDLFGLRQVYLYARDREPKPIAFRTPFLYKIVRHPLYMGFLIAFWFAPVMSVSQFVFTLGMTGYILIGIAHEEKDMVAAFGDKYRNYRRRVPGVIPLMKLTRPGTKSASETPRASGAYENRSPKRGYTR